MTKANNSIDDISIGELRRRNTSVDKELTDLENEIREKNEIIKRAKARNEVAKLLDCETDEIIDEIDELRKEHGKLKEEANRYRRKHRGGLEDKLKTNTDYSDGEIDDMSVDELGEKAAFLEHVDWQAIGESESSTDSYHTESEGVINTPKSWNVNPRDA